MGGFCLYLVFGISCRDPEQNGINNMIFNWIFVQFSVGASKYSFAHSEDQDLARDFQILNSHCKNQLFHRMEVFYSY